MKPIIEFICVVLFGAAILSPIALALWHFAGRHIWKKLPTWTQHALTTLAALTLLFGVYTLSRQSWDTDIQDNDTGQVRRQILHKDIWGNINAATIQYRGGTTYTGTPDADGDPHGKWEIYIPPTDGLVGHNRVEWYFHGEKCTKAEFYKWSD